MAVGFYSYRNYLYGTTKAFDYLDAPIKRITTPDTPAPFSAPLFAEWFPKVEEVKEEIKK